MNKDNKGYFLLLLFLAAVCIVQLFLVSLIRSSSRWVGIAVFALGAMVVLQFLVTAYVVIRHMQERNREMEEEQADADEEETDETDEFTEELEDEITDEEEIKDESKYYETEEVI